MRKNENLPMSNFINKAKSVIILLVVTILAAGSGVNAATRDYDQIAAKASRFFKYQEWANAAAMYELMIEDSAKVCSTYGHAIVVAAMRRMPDYEISLLERAQQNLIPVDSVFNAVQNVSFGLGQSSLYENFLLLVKDRQPWMKRNIEKQLLNYYVFRRNAPQMIRYSEIMLSGAPENVNYLTSLAQGYMLNGDEEAGIAKYKDILALYPDDYNTLLTLGNYYAIKNARQEALPYLQRADSISPTPYVKELIKRLTAK
jgi:tetratricopeptide (TPR) repeat protein